MTWILLIGSFALGYAYVKTRRQRKSQQAPHSRRAA